MTLTIESHTHYPPAPTYTEATAHAAPQPNLHSGICHGTLGELLQGPVVIDGTVQIGLISLPIKRYSWMHFTPGVESQLHIDLADKEKCQHIIKCYLTHHQRSLPVGRWSCDSELLTGKGMASSTADMVATIRCLDAIFGLQSSADCIAALLRQVERSDSVFLDTYALYLSGQQRIIHRFAGDPHFHACYIDEGDSIDTEKTGPTLLAYYQQHLAAYTDNLEQAIHAFRLQQAARIAQCATRSAELAQGVLPKRHFATLRAQQQRFHADGVVVAHTGSLLGYLYVQQPDVTLMGELSAFFRSIGHQCRFAQTGF